MPIERVICARTQVLCTSRHFVVCRGWAKQPLMNNGFPSAEPLRCATQFLGIAAFCYTQMHDRALRFASKHPPCQTTSVRQAVCVPRSQASPLLLGETPNQLQYILYLQHLINDWAKRCEIHRHLADKWGGC